MPTGYARASTDDQSLGVQRHALRLAGCGTFCQDRIGGAKAARAGDVPKARRFGRSPHDLILLGRTPDGAGIGLMSMQEIDAGSSGGRLAFRFRT